MADDAPKMVPFRGGEVIEGWPERLQEAQEQRIDPRTGLERVRCKQERCHDCAAQAGELHVPGCDMERCPKCGGQAISCEADCSSAFELN